MSKKPFYVNYGLGLNTKDNPKKLKDGECSIAQDCNFDEGGSIRSRFWNLTYLEYDYVPKTIFPYNDLFVCLENGDIYDGETLLVSEYGPGPFSCAEYNDVLYFVTRSATQFLQKRYDKTNVQNMGNDGPAAAPTVADAAVAGNPDGTYQYKYTYVDSNGKESSASPVSDEVTVVTNKVNVGIIESSDSKISSINIYRLGGSLTAWYLLAEGEDNDTATYVDNIADSTLVTLFDADNNDAPSNIEFITEHFQRLTGSKTGDYPHGIFWTVEFEPEYWGSGTDFQYLLGGYDPNTGLLSFNRVVVFFKKGSIYVLEGTDPSTWYKRRSNSSVGNISPYCIDVWKLPIFASYDGLYTFNGDLANKFSEKVNPFFNGDHKDHLTTAVGKVFNNKYYFSCDGETLVYDLLYDRFYTYDFEATAFAHDDVNNFLYGGVGNNVVKLEQKANDSLDTVNFQIKSKAYPLHEIEGQNGELYRYIVNINTKKEDVSFKVYIDKVLKQTITLNTSSMQKVEGTFGVIDSGAYAEFEFVYSGTKQIQIDMPVVINNE